MINMFKLIPQKLYKQQKGAMFGLDARISLSIFAGISLITGVTMINTINSKRIDNLLIEHSQYSNAVDNMQEDTLTNIHNAITNAGAGANTDAFMSLVDSSLLKAAFTGSWQGPYIGERTNNLHKDYGEMTLIKKVNTITAADCTGVEIIARQCSYFITFNEVPIEIVTEVDTRLDGGGETTPTEEGIAQWDSIAGGNAKLHLRLGILLP